MKFSRLFAFFRGSNLLGENLRKVGERFEFERVARRVEKKHRRLLANFARETRFRFDDESDAFAFQSFGKFMKIGGRQNNAEMRHRNVVGVNVVDGAHARCFGREMRDDLMSEKIEINPAIRASAFFAAENFAVKLSRFFQILNGKSQMK